MGSGDYLDFPQEQYQMSQTIEKIQLVEEIQHVEESIGLGQQIVNWIGDRIGWWPVLGFIVLGALFMFRKKIKKAVKAFLT